MPLLEVQRALARLYTDQSSIDRLHADTEAFAKAFHLCAAEVQELRLLPEQRLRSYARSLVRKRAMETRRLLPRTATALGSAFADTFAAYAREARLGDHPRYIRDACGFAAFLERTSDDPEVTVSARAEARRLSARIRPVWLRGLF